MSKNDVFQGMQRPTAPEGLRQRTLAAARAAAVPQTERIATEPSEPRRLVDRLGAHPAFRLAWAALFVAAVAANLLLAAPYRQQVPPSPASSSSTQPVLAEEFAEDAEIFQNVRRYRVAPSGIQIRINTTSLDRLF